MRLGDVLPDPGEELVVTTLGGDVFVYNWLTPLPLYRSWARGGVGIYNSIKVADLDGGAVGAEMYCAGSLGVHKWRRSTP